MDDAKKQQRDPTDDRRRFRPLRAIRRIFRDGRKAIRNTNLFRGSMSVNPNDIPSHSSGDNNQDRLLRAFSHESVFAPDRQQEASHLIVATSFHSTEQVSKDKPKTETNFLPIKSNDFKIALEKKLKRSSYLSDDQSESVLSTSAPPGVSAFAEPVAIKHKWSENEMPQSIQNNENKPIKDMEENLLDSSMARDRIAVKLKTRRRRNHRHLLGNTMYGTNITSEVNLIDHSFSKNDETGELDLSKGTADSTAKEFEEPIDELEKKTLSTINKTASQKSPQTIHPVPSLDEVIHVKLKKSNSKLDNLVKNQTLSVKSKAFAKEETEQSNFITLSSSPSLIDEGSGKPKLSAFNKSENKSKLPDQSIEIKKNRIEPVSEEVIQKISEPSKENNVSSKFDTDLDINLQKGVSEKNIPSLSVDVGNKLDKAHSATQAGELNKGNNSIQSTKSFNNSPPSLQNNMVVSSISSKVLVESNSEPASFVSINSSELCNDREKPEKDFFSVNLNKIPTSKEPKQIDPIAKSEKVETDQSNFEVKNIFKVKLKKTSSSNPPKISDHISNIEEVKVECTNVLKAKELKQIKKDISIDDDVSNDAMTLLKNNLKKIKSAENVGNTHEDKDDFSLKLNDEDRVNPWKDVLRHKVGYKEFSSSSQIPSIVQSQNSNTDGKTSDSNNQKTNVYPEKLVIKLETANEALAMPCEKSSNINIITTNTHTNSLSTPSGKSENFGFTSQQQTPLSFKKESAKSHDQKNSDSLIFNVENNSTIQSQTKFLSEAGLKSRSRSRKVPSKSVSTDDQQASADPSWVSLARSRSERYKDKLQIFSAVSDEIASEKSLNESFVEVKNMVNKKEEILPTSTSIQPDILKFDDDNARNKGSLVKAKSVEEPPNQNFSNQKIMTTMSNPENPGKTLQSAETPSWLAVALNKQQRWSQIETT